MSDKELNTDQIKILQRILNFTPTPNSNVSELKADIDNFCRKLRLNEYSSKLVEANETSVTSNEIATMNESIKSLVTNPSKFCPQAGRNQ